jgi:hypothetical protein
MSNLPQEVKRQLNQLIDPTKEYTLLDIFNLSDDLSLKHLTAQSTHKDSATLKSIFTVRDYSAVKPEEKNKYIPLCHEYESLSRSTLIHLIHHTQNDLSQSELFHLEASTQIADAIDSIYLQWSKLEQSLSPSEREEKGWHSRWHLSVERNGQHEFASLRTLYPTEFAQIESALSLLIEKLSATGESTQYFESLLAAYSEEDHHRSSKLWYKAEEKYANQSGRLKMVHPFEINGSKNLVIPLHSSRLFLQNHPSNQLIRSQQKQVLELFPALLTNHEKALSHLEAVKKTNVGLYHFGIRSGFELTYRIAGHNTPNEAQVRADHGGIIYLDPLTMSLRMQEIKPLMSRVFQGRYDETFNHIHESTPFSLLGIHELSHNIGDKRIFNNCPEVDALEEWKAYAAMYALVTLTETGWSNEKLLRLILTHIGLALRNITHRAESSYIPYYQSDIFFLKTMQEEGLLSKSNDTWSLSTDRKALLSFAQKVSQQYLNLLSIYESGSSEDLLTFYNTAAQNSLFVLDAITTLNGYESLDS